MYDPLKDQIQTMEATLAQMKQRYAAQSTLNNQAQLPQINMDQIGLIIQNAVAGEFQRLFPNQPASTPAPPPAPATNIQEPVSPEAYLHQTIDRVASDILTPEQLQWLAQPQVFKGIMVFLKSGKGQQAISLILDEYKSFLN